MQSYFVLWAGEHLREQKEKKESERELINVRAHRHFFELAVWKAPEGLKQDSSGWESNRQHANRHTIRRKECIRDASGQPAMC